MRALACMALAALAWPSQSGAAADEPVMTCATHDVVVAGLVRVGRAELALADCADARRVLDDRPKRYSITLARPLTGDALADSARELLRRNLGTAASLPAFECMNRAYRDATQGDRYDIEWHPADGLRLRLNGRTLAQCPAPAAAAGYFSIWFGESPFQARTRDALLGQALSRG